MTRWLTRQENVHSFDHELSWLQAQQSVAAASSSPTPPTPMPTRPHILLPKVPTSPNKSLSSIEKTHSVPKLTEHLKHYLEMLKPGATSADVTWAVSQSLPFAHVDVYHSFKFLTEQLEEGAVDQKDIAKASPLNGGRFDTVVVLTADTAESVSLQGK